MNRSDHSGNDSSRNNGKYSDSSANIPKSQGTIFQTKRQLSTGSDKSITGTAFQCATRDFPDSDFDGAIWRVRVAENIHIPNDQVASSGNPAEEDFKVNENSNRKRNKLSSSASASAIMSQYGKITLHNDGHLSKQQQEGSKINCGLELPGSQSDERNLSPIPSNLDTKRNHLNVHLNSSTSSPRLRSRSPNQHASGESSDDKGEKYDHFNLSVSREGSFERSVSFQDGILDQQFLADKNEPLRSAESSRSLDHSRNLDSSSTSMPALSSSGSKDRKESREGGKSSEKDKKSRKAWYNVLNPTYKSRSEDLKRLFKDLPSDERLIVDYSCALQKDILVHGRLYVTPNYFCFYSKIFGWETFLCIKCRDIVSMTKEKTALVIPNALQINTETEKNFFTSFAARDKTYMMLFRIWQNALIGQVRENTCSSQVSATELWHWVHSSYGEELGLTSDDDDYVAPSTEDDTKGNNFIPSVDQQSVTNEGKMNKSIATDSTEDVSHPESNQEDKSEPTTRSASEVKNRITRSASDAKDRRVGSIAKSISRSSTRQSSPFIVSPQLSMPPADLSDSNESEHSATKIPGPLTETVICPNVTTHHQGREVINTVFALPIDDVFTYLFTNSKFILDLHKHRNTTDVIPSEWQSNPETNQKIRQVTYTLTLPTTSFGPKVSHVTETQVMSAFSKSNEIYTIDAEACNGGIPYADYFSVSNHWCLTRETANETRLSVWTEVKYKKNVWGFMKSVIDKNSFSGVKSLMNDICSALLKEVDKTTLTKPNRRRRRRVGSKSSDLTDQLPVQGDKIKDTHKATQIPTRRATLPLISTEIPLVEVKSSLRPTALLCLLALLCVNAFIYYRLYALEDKMANGVRHPVTFDPALFKHGEDVPIEEWIKILHEQEALHSADVDRWKNSVSEAADYLKKAEESLRNLHTSIPHNEASKVKSLLRHLQILQQLQDQRSSSQDRRSSPLPATKPPDDIIASEFEQRHDL